VGNVAFAETNTVKAIGDNQLKRLQSEQGADDHLVETGQQQEHLPQATAPVVPDRSDNDPTCQRRHYRGFQAHGPGLYAVPSTSEIRATSPHRRCAGVGSAELPATSRSSGGDHRQRVPLHP